MICSILLNLILKNKSNTYYCHGLAIIRLCFCIYREYKLGITFYIHAFTQDHIV